MDYFMGYSSGDVAGYAAAAQAQVAVPTSVGATPACSLWCESKGVLNSAWHATVNGGEDVGHAILFGQGLVALHAVLGAGLMTERVEDVMPAYARIAGFLKEHQQSEVLPEWSINLTAGASQTATAKLLPAALAAAGAKFKIGAGAGLAGAVSIAVVNAAGNYIITAMHKKGLDPLNPQAVARFVKDNPQVYMEALDAAGYSGTLTAIVGPAGERLAGKAATLVPERFKFYAEKGLNAAVDRVVQWGKLKISDAQEPQSFWEGLRLAVFGSRERNGIKVDAAQGPEERGDAQYAVSFPDRGPTMH